MPVTIVLKETLADFNLVVFYPNHQSAKFNSPPIFRFLARFKEDCEKERAPDTDEELGQLLSLLPLDLALDVMPSKFAPPTQPYPPQC